MKIFEIDLRDVFSSNPFEARDAIVARLRDSGWIEARDEDEREDLRALVDALQATDSPEGFDQVWGGLVAAADWDRITLVTDA